MAEALGDFFTVSGSQEPGQVLSPEPVGSLAANGIWKPHLALEFDLDGRREVNETEDRIRDETGDGKSAVPRPSSMSFLVRDKFLTGSAKEVREEERTGP